MKKRSYSVKDYYELAESAVRPFKEQEKKNGASKFGINQKKQANKLSGKHRIAEKLLEVEEEIRAATCPQKRNQLTKKKQNMKKMLRASK